MSGKRSKPPQRPAATSAANKGASAFRIAEIYDRYADEAGILDRFWAPARRHGPERPPLVEPMRLPEDWPTPPRPIKPLQPSAGHVATGKTGQDGALVVTLFGLGPERLSAAVRNIEQQYAAAPNYRPVFLTDSTDTTILRRAGLTHEYFPTAIYGGLDQAERFAARFAQLWRKWNGQILIDFSASGFLAQRIEDLGLYIERETTIENRYDPRLKRPPPPQKPVTDIAVLRADYQAAGLHEVADTFVLYRVLGNDLPPRHEIGQTRANLQFMLDHEPDFPNCEKRWVVNRIVEPEEEAAIIALLEAHDQSYLRIPFLLEEYAEIGWDLQSFHEPAFFLRGGFDRMVPYDQMRAEAHLRRHKNNYVINNNGARNAALRDGKGRAKWVLPWDGNCFLTTQAWEEIVKGVLAQPYLKYFTVPMARATDNADLLDPAFRPEPDSEPQMLFRFDSAEEFNEEHYYGRRPKVELFYRLGIPGPWDRFKDDEWDLPRPEASPDIGTTGEAGWVARLFSGQGRLETEAQGVMRARGEARIEGIVSMLDRLDVAGLERSFRSEDWVCFDEASAKTLAHAPTESAEAKLFERLKLDAELALQRGPYSVVDKTAVPPNGDPHDYYHAAPYWWPNPATANGLPFVWRDGERLPGTRLYEPESARYDRTRLQRLFDDTTVLALAAVSTGDSRFAEHAAGLVRAWFLDPETRMNPNIQFAQVRSIGPLTVGESWGLIEMKDLYYFLDAVRIVEQAGALSEDERKAFRAWLREYLDWLLSSDQGQAERRARNNHGTCFDLQTASIAAFLGDTALLVKTFRTSQERIFEQFGEKGRQLHEMKRTQTAHYTCFNLQCWVNLATLAEACGVDLWSFEGRGGRGIARAFCWLLPHMGKPWRHEQIEPFDPQRFLPLFFAARDRLGPTGTPQLTQAIAAPPTFFAHDGIKPYWMLGRKAKRHVQTEAWQDLAEQLPRLEQAAFDTLHTPPAPKSDVVELAEKLEAGFADEALDGLQRMHAAADPASDQGRNSALALARFAFAQGDYRAALSYTEEIEPDGGRGLRDQALFRGWCLAQSDGAEPAADILREALELFPQDPELCLAMAHAHRGTPDFAAWVNRLYRTSELTDFLAETPSDAWQPVRAEITPASPETGALVSVILAGPSGAPLAEGVLSSLQAQSWDQLEILLIDRSSAQMAALDVTTVDDPRVTVVSMPVDTPDHAAWNTGLARAHGLYVTRHSATEYAHPDKIARQLAALEDGAEIALAQSAHIAPNGQVLPRWQDRFALLHENTMSLIIRTETLRAFGGWDSVVNEADRVLIWRLEQAGLWQSRATICPQAPLSLIQPMKTAKARIPEAAAVIARLARQRAVANDTQNAEPPRIAPYQGEPMGQPAEVEAAYFGDFSVAAPALPQLHALISSDAAEGRTIGLFHWPDVQEDWRAPMDPAIASLIDAGEVTEILPYGVAKAGRLVLCHSYLIDHPPDGLPDVSAERIDILGGPELYSGAYEGRRRRPPAAAERIERFFSKHCRWVSI